jgi:hypothetical protein
MEVFRCPTCKTDHNYDNVNPINVCDFCKQDINSYSDLTSCSTCENYKTRYHRACVQKLGGGYYCPNHQAKKREAMNTSEVIQKYIIQFWTEVGGQIHSFQMLNTASGFYVKFPSLELRVYCMFYNKTRGAVNIEYYNDAITTFNYNVAGLKKHGRRDFEVGLHNHESAKMEIVSAILRSLTSKMGSITAEQNNKAKHLRKFKTSKLGIKIDAGRKRAKVFKTMVVLKAKLEALKKKTKEKV